MAAVARKLWEAYLVFDGHAQAQYPEGLPAILNPLYVTILLSTYLAFVYKWGPQFMESRKPFGLRSLMIAYNGLQVAANLYLFIGISVNILRHGGNIFACMENEPSLVKFSMFYFINKLSDLIETVFFVLRKKNNQISFLHVYHHVAVIIAAYFTVITDPGGHASLPSALNAMIHSLMYSYYLVSILIGMNPTLNSYKKRITQVQIIQFCILVYHFGVGALQYCKFTIILGAAGVVQNTFMLTLFTDFYIRTYIKARSKPDKPVKAES